MRKITLQVLLLILFLPANAQEDALVKMSTSMGDITLQIYSSKAPITAGNFLQHVDSKDFDGASFYRVVTQDNDQGSPIIEVIQGGLGGGADAYTAIAHETTEQTGILHTDGVISMARAAVGTATTEFFIIIGDQPSLDYDGTRNADRQGFAAFGKVINGMDVVRAIQDLPADGISDSEYTRGQILNEPVRIYSMERLVTQ